MPDALGQRGDPLTAVVSRARPRFADCDGFHVRASRGCTVGGMLVEYLCGVLPYATCGLDSSVGLEGSNANKDAVEFSPMRVEGRIRFPFSDPRGIR